MKPIRYPLFSALICLLSAGCLEHNYTFSVLPDNRIEVKALISGDIVDMQDGRELQPDSALWRVTRSVEERDDETVHTLEGSVTVSDSQALTSALNWRTTTSDSLKLQPLFSLIHHPRLFGTEWKFRGVVPSREFNATYGDIWDYVPPECRALQNDSAKALLNNDDLDLLEKKFALGIFQWNQERYLKQFDYVWSRMKALHGSQIADTTDLTASISRTGWADDLHLYLSDLDIGDPSLANLDWWKDLRPLFLGRISDLTGPAPVGEIGDIADAFEEKYQITKDLQDDIFRVYLNVPGRITATNGAVDGQTGALLWESPGKAIMDSSLTMSAESFVLSYGKVSVVVGVMVVVVLALFIKITAGKRRPA